jgi:hypothetical protein
MTASIPSAAKGGTFRERSRSPADRSAGRDRGAGQGESADSGSAPRLRSRGIHHCSHRQIDPRDEQDEEPPEGTSPTETAASDAGSGHRSPAQKTAISAAVRRPATTTRLDGVPVAT